MVYSGEAATSSDGFIAYSTQSWRIFSDFFQAVDFRKLSRNTQQLSTANSQFSQASPMGYPQYVVVDSIFSTIYRMFIGWYQPIGKAGSAINTSGFSASSTTDGALFSRLRAVYPRHGVNIVQTNPQTQDFSLVALAVFNLKFMRILYNASNVISAH